MKRQPNKVDAKAGDRGDLIFFYPRPTNLFQKVISWFDGKYFHCGILLSYDIVLSMSRRGVMIEPISNYRGCRYDVYTITIDRCEIEKLLKYIKRLTNEKTAKEG